MELLVVGRNIEVSCAALEERGSWSLRVRAGGLEYDLVKVDQELRQLSADAARLVHGTVTLPRSAPTWLGACLYGGARLEHAAVQALLDSLFSRSLDEWREHDVKSGRGKGRVEASEPGPARSPPARSPPARSPPPSSPPGGGSLAVRGSTSTSSSGSGLLRAIDELLSSFLQLSVLSLSRELRLQGKFPEGYLHKTPLYYHDELILRNAVVALQVLVAGGSLGLAAYLYFFAGAEPLAPWWWVSLLVGAVLVDLLLLLYNWVAQPLEPNRVSLLPCCMLPGLGQLLVLCYVAYGALLREADRRWLVFRPSHIAYFVSNYDPEPRGVFMVDKNTSLDYSWWSWLNPRLLRISNKDQTLSLYGSAAELAQWKRAIEATCAIEAPGCPLSPCSSSRGSAKRQHKYTFGRRSDVPCQWYADARFYFLAVYDAIAAARHEVWLADWILSPELELVRGAEEARARGLAGPADSQLAAVLGAAVRRGVRVHVLLFRDLAVAIPNNSEHAAAVLSRAGVFVIRHAAHSRGVGVRGQRFYFNPRHMPWSHHEKLCVVDQALAFVGGIDLAFGRYDDHTHRVADPAAATWPGKDFYNQMLREFEKLDEPDTDLLDRAVQPRMPWHDIACAVGGDAALDVATHFVARWNRELRQATSYREMRALKMQYLLPKQYAETVLHAFDPLAYRAKACRVLRSIGPWSLSATPEAAIKDSYLHLIAAAKSLIYIENQFFVSMPVAEAIADRLCRAVERQEQFRVIVLLPQWPGVGPGLPFENSQVKLILKHTHKAMDHVLDRLRAHPRVRSNQVDVNRYVGFYSLRKADIIGGRLASEQVYVHAKLMIVDDEKILVGSANLNGRSLEGDRDSEIDLYLHAPELARDLRCALFAEHLGLHQLDCAGCRVCSEACRQARRAPHPDADSKTDTASLDNKTMALVHDAFSPLWDATAQHNYSVFERLLPGVQPAETLTTIAAARCALRAAQARRIEIGFEAEADEARPQLAAIQGHLVKTPLAFLRKEANLTPSIADAATYFLPEAVFI